MQEHYTTIKIKIKELQIYHVDVTKLQGSLWLNKNIWSVCSLNTTLQMVLSISLRKNK